MLLKLCVMWLTAFCCHAQNALNVALNKPTSQSTTHTDFTSGSAAVDGRTPGGDITEFMTCIHTSIDTRDESPSWQVDLGHVYPVAYITIYGRPGFLRRMVDTIVIIDSNTCFSIQDIPSTYRFNVSCTTALTGRMVRIERHSRNRWDVSLNMCEVEVWVCKDGKYGAKCHQSCGHCEGETCDKASGRCQRGCDPGWQGQECHTSCSDGKYGWNCSLSCGQCANSTCDKVTGTCPSGCAPGWTDDLCQTACEDGTYGWNCSQSCGECANVPCDKVTGRCHNGCQPGWKDDLCQTDESHMDTSRKKKTRGDKLTVVVIEYKCLHFPLEQSDASHELSTSCSVLSLSGLPLLIHRTVRDDEPIPLQTMCKL